MTTALIHAGSSGDVHHGLAERKRFRAVLDGGNRVGTDEIGQLLPIGRIDRGVERLHRRVARPFLLGFGAAIEIGKFFCHVIGQCLGLRGLGWGKFELPAKGGQIVSSDLIEGGLRTNDVRSPR